MSETKADFCWQCNECGSNEYTSSVSGADVQRMTCAGCGNNEFHKVPIGPSETKAPIPALWLKHLQPAQYESWLKKAHDPEWVEHRYRTSEDRAMRSAILDLEAARECIAVLEERNRELVEALEGALSFLTKQNRALAEKFLKASP